MSGETYNAYQVETNAAGVHLQETFDLNSGGHTLLALTGDQRLTGLGNDKMTGDGATTFVFNSIYGAGVVTNLTSSDSVSLPQSEFDDFAAMLSHAENSGANVVISATDGDTLTLKNMTLSTLAGLSNNFTFSA